MALNLHHHQTAGPNNIGELPSGQQALNMNDYISFESGQFAGRKVRLELEEIQKASSGRKYAKVDRRPLDPPPAVRLRLFEDEGEWENELVGVLNVGLMCSVDLFPVPEALLEDLPGADPSAQETSNPGVAPVQLTSNTTNPTAQFPLTYYPLHPFMSAESPPSGGESSSHSPPPSTVPFQIPRRQPMLSTLTWGTRPLDTVHQIGNHLVTESSKLTPALVGERFSEPTVIDHDGEEAFVFVFGDLAVRREGTFILRYRAFDIFSTVLGMPDTPLLAELYGRPFKVYSTRDFPGLEPSTDLTRTLARCGVRVTLRDAERKSKKRPKKND